MCEAGRLLVRNCTQPSIHVSVAELTLFVAGVNADRTLAACAEAFERHSGLETGRASLIEGAQATRGSASAIAEFIDGLIRDPLAHILDCARTRQHPAKSLQSIDIANTAESSDSSSLCNFHMQHGDIRFTYS